MSVILATAGYDHKIRFWEAPSGICSRVLKYPDSQVNKLEITPDKQFLAAGGNPHIRIYEIADGSTPTNVVGGGVSSPTGGGGAVVGGGGGNTSSTTNSDQQQQHQQQPVLTLEGHTSSVTSLGFQRDGRYLYSGSEDGTIKLWDLRNPTYSRSFDAKAPVRSVTLRVDKDEIISGDANGMVKIWDLSGSGNTTTSSTSSNNINTSSSSSSNPTNNENIARGNVAAAAAAANNNNNRGTTTTATHATKNHSSSSSSSSSKKSKGLIHSLQPADGYTGGCLLQTSIQAVDISEDSRTLVAVSNHGTVYVWDPKTLDSISSSLSNNTNASIMKGSSSSTILPAEDGGPVVEGNNNIQSSSPYQQSQPALITKFRAHPQPGSYCLHARISPDCRTLCTTGSDGSAKLWDTTTWKLSQNLTQQHSKWVWDAAFCADSSYLVTASSDTTARLWNLRSGEVVRQYHGHQSAVTCVALNDSSV